MDRLGPASDVGRIFIELGTAIGGVNHGLLAHVCII